MHLLLVSLGPVQDFIAASRRCRDLWFGSWLVSEWSKAAARAIAQASPEGVGSLVFPCVDDVARLAPNTPLNVANKILAVVDDPESVAAAARTAAQERLRSISEKAFDLVGRRDLVDWTRARAQVEDLLEFTWVSVPMSGDHAWADDRKRVEALMGARKNSRVFAPVEWGGPVDKSSLDGQRESVIDAAVDATRRTPDQGALQLRRWLGVRRGEHLCGIGLMKRHGGSLARQGIASTSHVAAQPIIERLRPADTDALERYVDALRAAGISDEDLGHVHPLHPVFGRLDGHALFAERLVDVLPPDGLAPATRALQSFLSSIGVGQPSPYLAVLLADGDRMGKAIDACPTRERHRRLSAELARFAGLAKDIVEKHGGSLVYSGGDDVLALIGVHRAVPCARELAECFSRLLADFAYVEAGVRFAPTLSVGIGVGHHVQPLGDLLQLARKAEKEAKKHRNALALVVSKRSGSDMIVSGTWSDASGPAMDRRLETWTRLHHEDALPDGAAYELHALGSRIPKDEQQLQPVLKLECERILGRKQPGHGRNAALARQDMDVLRQALNLDGTADVDVQAIASELIIARLLADCEALARRDSEKEVQPA